MIIPTRVARRSHIAIGERGTLALLPQAIYLLPRKERVSARDRPYRTESGGQAAE
jgi:hypothetical protein